jgi:hypothetical protein
LRAPGRESLAGVKDRMKLGRVLEWLIFSCLRMKKWSLMYDLLLDNGGVRLVGVEDLLAGVEQGGEDLVWSEDRI